MDYNKPFNFLKNLPPKLNSFYITKSKSGLVVSNKSKSKKDFEMFSHSIVLDYRRNIYNSFFIAFLMLCAQYAHFSVKNSFTKFLPSFFLLCLSLTIGLYEFEFF